MNDGALEAICNITKKCAFGITLCSHILLIILLGEVTLSVFSYKPMMQGSKILLKDWINLMVLGLLVLNALMGKSWMMLVLAVYCDLKKYYI